MKKYLVQTRNKKNLSNEQYLAVISADNLFDLSKMILKLNWQDTVDIIATENDSPLGANTYG